MLAENFDPRALAQAYVDNGAAAVSVLTDPRFQGTLDDLEAVSQVAAPKRTPVIRKDFIFDPYQVYEARSRGADGLLLIAAILSPSHLAEMLAVCQELWLQALVEVHDEAELDAAVDAGAEIIGINNRNLHTFETSLSVTERLAGHVPPGKIIVQRKWNLHCRPRVTAAGFGCQRRAGGGGAGHRGRRWGEGSGIGPGRGCLIRRSFISPWN